MKPRKRIVDLTTHDQPFVTVSQVSAFLQVEKRSVLRWIEEGFLEATLLPARKGANGRRGMWRIKLASLQAFAGRRV